MLKFKEDRLDSLWKRVDELKDSAERTLDNEFQGWRDLASFDFDLVDSNTEPGIDVYVYFTRDESIPIPYDGFAEPEDIENDNGIIASKSDIAQILDVICKTIEPSIEYNRVDEWEYDSSRPDSVRAFIGLNLDIDDYDDESL